MYEDDQPTIGFAPEEIVRATITRVVYANAINGYTVVRMQKSQAEGEFTVVGNFIKPTIGNHFIVRGRYIDHAKYGKQLSATSVTPADPSTTIEIEEFLSSGLIPGIGEKTAQKLVREFGTETINILRDDPERIHKSLKISKQKLSDAQTVLRERQGEQEIIRFLMEHKLSPNLAKKIYTAYGARAAEIVTRDPYRLARDIDGIGFPTADKIAAEVGIARDASARLEAGLLYSLQRSADSAGHTALHREALLADTQQLLDFFEEEPLQDALAALIAEGIIAHRGDRVMSPPLYYAESSIARDIADRLKNPLSSTPLSDAFVEESIQAVETRDRITLTAEQRAAVYAVACNRFVIITGGPGCGKTTIVRTITELFKRAGRVIRLAAPTGRAGQRLGTICALPAQTIHRMLRYDPTTHTFSFNRERQLEADLVIIDEASMIDVRLGASLIEAVPQNATLVLVGDKDQLPSVGPGRVLADLLAVSGAPIVSLTQLFRREAESTINEIAHLINCGEVPEVPVPDGIRKVDAYFIPRSVEEAPSTIEKLVTTQLKEKFDFNVDDVMVLSPGNRGPLGIIELNQRLQSALNPQTDPEQELQIGDNLLRLGDRVCQRANNYDIDEYGVFNGDMGRVYAVDKAAGMLTVELWDGRLLKYTKTAAQDLSLGYAITIHRSQGSEIPCVVLVLHESHYTLLERQLLYTAVTRAKKLLIIVGSKRAFATACRRTNTERRRTFLRELIQEQLELHHGPQTF
jgi:exodeoxyribonuclease V alpha subunit